MNLEQVDHVAIAVTDMGRSIDWYQDVLGFERRHVEWGTAPAMLCVGSTCLALFDVEGEPRPAPGRDVIAMRHLAFRTDRAGLVRAQQELSERGIDWQFMDHESAHSIYFADPDGHRLEITTYDVESPESVYRRILDAFNRGDRETFLAGWHAQCEYRPALESGLEGSGSVCRGPGDLRSWWDRIHEDFQDMSAHLEEVHDLGDRVLGVIVFRAKGIASGVATEARFAQVGAYRDGKLLTARDYFDVDEGKRAIGL